MSAAGRAVLGAATIVLLLALGPFASPLVSGEDGGVTSEVPVDHRNDVPVVQPARASAPLVSSRQPTSRSLVIVLLVAGLVLAATPVVRRRPAGLLPPDRPPLWSRPPRRGPPLLTAG